MAHTKHPFEGLAVMVGWFSLPASERETDGESQAEHLVRGDG
jgi:hypothetical protein